MVTLFQFINRSFLFLLFITLFSSCSSDDKETVTEIDRTILIYMAADNSLSSNVIINLQQIIQGVANSSNQGHLLVYIDQKESDPALYLIDAQKGKILLKTYPEQNSASAEVLSNVLHDAFNVYYPSASNGLFLWSHGEGWLYRDSNASMAQSISDFESNPMSDSYDIKTKWILSDEENPTSTKCYLNIPNLRAALETCSPFDFIAFDACYMGCVEVAYELRKSVSNLLASPTEIMASNVGYENFTGYPYHQIISQLFAPEIDYKQIAYTFFSYYNAFNENSNKILERQLKSATIAWTRTSELDSLAHITQRILKNKEWTSYWVPTSGLQYFDRGRSTHLYYDLLQFIESISPDSSDLLLFQEQLKRVVPATWHTPYYAMSLTINTCCGLSIYLPTASNASYQKGYTDLEWYKDAGCDALPNGN